MRCCIFLLVALLSFAQQGPKRAQKLVRDGIRFETGGQYVEALKAFSAAIDVAPQDEVAWFHRARVRYTQGDFKNALLDLDKAVQLAPSDGAIWQLRGDCHRQLKDQAKALADYDQALKLNVDSPALYNARAGIYP